MKSYGVTIQIIPLQQYFHMLLFIQHVVLTFEYVNEILWCYYSNETCSAVLSHGTIYLVCSLTFESVNEILWYPTIIQMNPFQHCFHMVLFIQNVVLIFEPVNEITWCVTIHMKPLQQCFHTVLFIQYVVLTFESVDKILRCDHSTETSFIFTRYHLFISISQNQIGILVKCSPQFITGCCIPANFF